MIIKLIKIFLLLTLVFPYAWADEQISACPEGSISRNKYIIEQNKIISVGPDVYLESAGTQHINTGIIPTQNTRVVAMIEITSNNGYNWIFGVINRNTLGKQSCYGLAINGEKYYSEISGNNKNYGGILPHNITHEFDFTVTTLKNAYNTYSTGATNLAQTETQMYLFANNNSTGSIYDQRFIGRIYYFKIYEGDELIRHFVPVPNGMQIGDFTVPSNGMWDIVEQKFYGNISNGDFIYGEKCTPCPAHQYYENNLCYDCPPGYTDDRNAGKVSISDCKIHCVGGYIANKYDTKCTDSGVGFWAPRSYVSYGQTSTPHKCPENMTSSGHGMSADEIDDCGRILWVNNKPIYLRNTKKTTPSLNVKLGDSIFYANTTPMTTLVGFTNLNSNLHIKHNNVIYLVHDDGLYNNINIAYNTYLEATGVEYINTEFIPSQNTTIEVTVMPTSANGYSWFFGNIDRTTLGKRSCFGLAQFNGYLYSEISGTNTQYTPMLNNTKYTFTFTSSDIHLDNSVIPTGANKESYTPATFPMYLFANNNGTGTYDQRFKGRIYDFKIYEAGELVRHFVPVHLGTHIGNFIVPSNGMWDQIEQRFYENIGTGSFIYGIEQ
ncbi:MAG: hypothetical protein R8M71_03185 [Alphaproteobacteria bacterium]|nr:hypothetical protein [Alphaproteobacteria bacterium]